MDQLLTQFGIAWPKFAAQVILFLIVYAILRKFAFAPIIAIFEQRRRTIEEGQANAEKIKKHRGPEVKIQYPEESVEDSGQKSSNKRAVNNLRECKK
jgi:hypothetical protein